jgi:hypothetical protein
MTQPLLNTIGFITRECGFCHTKGGLLMTRVDKLCDLIHNHACGDYCGIYYYNLTLGYGAHYPNYKLSVMTEFF